MLIDDFDGMAHAVVDDLRNDLRIQSLGHRRKACHVGKQYGYRAALAFNCWRYQRARSGGARLNYDWCRSWGWRRGLGQGAPALIAEFRASSVWKLTARTESGQPS